MRRPPGLTPPPAPPPPPTPPSSPASSTSRSSTKRARSTPESSSSEAREAATTARKGRSRPADPSPPRDADEHLTEPILLDRTALRGGARTAAPSERARTSSEPTRSGRSDTDARGTNGRDTAGRDSDGRGSGRSSASELRRAVRARRRYERQEARRFTQWSRRRRISWLVGLGVAVGLVVVVLLAAYSPLLSVRTIEVTGTSRLDAAAVEAAVSDQLGRPLALVDEGAIRDELSQFPLIKSFAIEALPPSGLGIRIVERTPVAQVQTPSGWDVVDPAGVVVQTSSQQVPGYPVYDLAGTQLGGAAFAAAGTALAALPANLLAQVTNATAATPDSITFTFGASGQRVVWGSAEQSALKTLILQRLIATQDPSRAVEYDVSSPESPVMRGG
ncbi:cell division protein FtsQ [Humibacter sp. BT305]|nr:cell division protein FtsQ [Humibacter sp. BT305]